MDTLHIPVHIQVSDHTGAVLFSTSGVKPRTKVVRILLCWLLEGKRGGSAVLLNVSGSHIFGQKLSFKQLFRSETRNGIADCEPGPLAYLKKMDNQPHNDPYRRDGQRGDMIDDQLRLASLKACKNGIPDGVVDCS